MTPDPEKARLTAGRKAAATRLAWNRERVADLAPAHRAVLDRGGRA